MTLNISIIYIPPRNKPINSIFIIIIKNEKSAPITNEPVSPINIFAGNLLFKRKYLIQAQEFYNKHGGGAIIVARFIPIVRTFAPIVAGIVGMDQKKFVSFNIIGSIAWVFSMLFAGHFLQKWILSEFGFDLKHHLEIIVLGIVFFTTAPVIIKLFFGKSNKA